MDTKKYFLAALAYIVCTFLIAAQAEPSQVIELNRAVAVAMRDGPLVGLELVDTILKRGDLDTYRLAHAAGADLCWRLEQTKEARTSYQRALSLTQQEPERRFLEKRLSELQEST